MKGISRLPRLIIMSATLLALARHPDAMADPLTNAPGSWPVGTYFSATGLTPPLPYHPYPQLKTEAIGPIGDNRFVYDDTELDYSALWQASEALATPAAGEAGAGGPESLSALGAGSFACALWLDISRSTNDAVIVTLHNTIPGTNYQLLSIGNLWSNNWALETNVTGASGQDSTPVRVAFAGRTNLFFRASESRNYVIDTNANFGGLTFQDAGFEVPDTMGAVGPNHFVELLNGVIAVYSKGGALLEKTNSRAFFAVQVGATNFPQYDLIDGRMLYDSQAGRWVACALERFGLQNVLLAVSRNANPSLTNWEKRVFPVFRSYSGADATTLGMDGNGLYLTVLQIDQPVPGEYHNIGHTVVAIRKPDIFQGVAISTRFEVMTNELLAWTIQPAVNFDDVPANGPAWFVAKGSPKFSPTYEGGAIWYRRLGWTATNAFGPTRIGRRFRKPHIAIITI